MNLSKGRGEGNVLFKCMKLCQCDPNIESYSQVLRFFSKDVSPGTIWYGRVAYKCTISPNGCTFSRKGGDMKYKSLLQRMRADPVIANLCKSDPNNRFVRQV
jgi:hypothetical protein